MFMAKEETGHGHRDPLDPKGHGKLCCRLPTAVSGEAHGIPQGTMAL